MHGAEGVDRDAQREAAIERLADAIEAGFDLDALFALR